MRIVNILGKLVLSISFICFASLASIAAENNLSGVEMGNSADGYQITFRVDQPTDVRKTVKSANEVILSLKNVTPLESVNTIYNDVPDVDSVLIMPDTKSTRVIIRGKNISGTSVNFLPASAPDTEAVDAAQTFAEPDELKLSPPIQAYRPVYPRTDRLYDSEEQSSALINMARDVVSLSPALKMYAKKIYKYTKNIDNKILVLGAIFMLVIIFGFKSLASNKRDDEMKVGLSRSLKDREVGMKEQFNLSNELKTLRAQKSNPTQAAPSINYGIKAYQTSQKNPYTSQYQGAPAKKAVTPPVKPAVTQEILQNTAKYNQAAQNIQRTHAQGMQRVQAQNAHAVPNSTPVSPVVNKKPPTRPVANQSVDSMKFLESMAKIYEKSGRTDLANGLKSNIQKVHAAK